MDKTTVRTMHETLTAISLINDIEALKRIQKEVRKKLSFLEENEANQIYWQIGMRVQLKPEYQNRKPYKTAGTVEKVNPKKIKVRMGEWQLWNIPKTMLQIAE